MASFLGLLFLVFGVLCVVGLIVGIILWATSGSGGSSEMSCGGCGYVVRGLSQLTCPECGADLREVGIGRGSSPGRRTTGIILTLCCGGLILLGCGGSTWLFLADGSSVQSVPAVQTLPSQPSTSSSSGQNVGTTLTDEDLDAPEDAPSDGAEPETQP